MVFKRSHEKAIKQIEYAISDIVNRHISKIHNGEIQQLPSFVRLQQEIFLSILVWTYYPTHKKHCCINCLHIQRSKEIKHCSKKWLLAQIDLMLKDYLEKIKY